MSVSVCCAGHRQPGRRPAPIHRRRRTLLPTAPSARAHTTRACDSVYRAMHTRPHWAARRVSIKPTPFAPPPLLRPPARQSQSRRNPRSYYRGFDADRPHAAASRRRAVENGSLQALHRLRLGLEGDMPRRPPNSRDSWPCGSAGSTGQIAKQVRYDQDKPALFLARRHAHTRTPHALPTMSCMS